MRTIELSVPGKVFIAGEYLALLGGSTLLAGIEPRFTLVAQFATQPSSLKSAQSFACPFHLDSPAGKFWLKNKAKLQFMEIQFQDPHRGQGGFGSSTAEFILLYALQRLQDSASVDAQAELDLKVLLQEYRDLAATPGYTPSGADLVAQVRGGLTFFSREHGQLQNYSWLYPELGFFIAKTNFKLKTHEHLAELGQFPRENFDVAMKLVQGGLEGVDRHSLVRGLQSFAEALAENNFVCENTQRILQALTAKDNAGILLPKGCGAMGADVIFVLYDKNLCASEEVRQMLVGLGLQIVATEKDLSKGLELKVTDPQLRPEEQTHDF